MQIIKIKVASYNKGCEKKDIVKYIKNRMKELK
jgi:hypothetical protein